MRLKTARQWSPTIIVAAAALAPALWFQSGLAIKSVDSFFSLNPTGHFQTSFQAWDAQMTAGEPAAPQVFALLNTVQYALVKVGLSLVAEQLVILTFLACSAVVGAFALALALLPPDLPIVRRRFAAAAAGVAWIANPFALSYVWWHQTLIEVTWAVVPWIVLLLTVATRRSRPVRTFAPLVVMVSVLGAAGLGLTYLPAILLLLGATAIGLILTERNRLRALRGAAIFFVVFAVSLSWWIIPTLGVAHQVYSDDVIGQPPLRELTLASAYSGLNNVVSLSAVLQLWAGVDNARYITWAPLVTSGVGSSLRFLLPAMAIAGLAYALGDKRSRYIGTFAALSGVVAAFGSKGLNPPFPNINLALLELPFGGVWRHPVDKLSVLLILPMCMLFAFAVGGMLRVPWTVPVGIASSAAVCGFLAAPWWNGTVIPSASGVIPSARVQVPSSYDEIGHALAQAPPGGKTVVLPYTPDGESAFRWTNGIQPNLDCLFQDWAPKRSLLCHGTGQPNANRLIDTIAGGILKNDPRVIDLARLAGIDRWLVHEDWASNYIATAISPKAATAYLDNPLSEPPQPPIPRAGQSVALPNGTRTVVLYAYRSAPPAIEDRLLQLGSIQLQINRYDAAIPEIFFALFDSKHHLWAPGRPVVLGKWHKLALHFESGGVFLEVDGIRDQQASIPFQASTAIRVLAPRKGASPAEITRPETLQLEGVPAPEKHESVVQPVMSTPELRLWKQRALPAVYAATSAYVSDLSSEKLLATAHESAQDRAPVVLNGAIPDLLNLDLSAWSVGKKDSATSYHGSLRLHGTSILVLLQSFDPGWKLVIDGHDVPTSQHMLVNGYANGWVVSGIGTLSWSLTYAPQRQLNIGYIFGGLLLAGAVLTMLVSLAWRIRKVFANLARKRAGLVGQDPGGTVATVDRSTSIAGRRK